MSKPARTVAERIADGDAGRCRWCGKVVRAVTPRGGDGSLQVLIRHEVEPGVRCDGSRSDVRR